jgi:hypothetical protein
MSPPLETLREPKQSSTFRAGPVPPESDDALDRSTIAEMPAKQIRRMSRSELARVIRSSPLPPAQARLEYLDLETLQRLAHMACFSCRNRR